MSSQRLASILLLLFNLTIIVIINAPIKIDRFWFPIRFRERNVWLPDGGNRMGTLSLSPHLSGPKVYRDDRVLGLRFVSSSPKGCEVIYQ